MIRLQVIGVRDDIGEGLERTVDRGFRLIHDGRDFLVREALLNAEFVGLEEVSLCNSLRISQTTPSLCSLGQLTEGLRPFFLK